MLKTLVFGAIAAFAGKKLYQSGALDEFISDARTRLGSSDRTASTRPVAPSVAPAPGATGPY